MSDTTATTSKRLFNSLSPRQRELAVLVSENKNRAEIATIMGISRKTVDAHLWVIKGRLGVPGLPGITLIVKMAHAKPAPLTADAAL